jgi:pimeloyl-ACP methyl ester carboxylesterase
MSSTGTNRRSFLIRSVLACGGLTGGAGLLAACGKDPDPELAAPPPGLYEDPPVPVFPEDVLVGEYLEVNGARIFYQALGVGEPMVLLHGYPLSGALFARNRDVLAERYRVITVDHRGYGKSQAPAVPGDIAVYAQDVLDVLATLDVRPAIIGGHSMSGPIILEMYQRAPERFRAMMLIDTIAAPASTIEAALWNGFAQAAREPGGVDTTVDFPAQEHVQRRHQGGSGTAGELPVRRDAGLLGRRARRRGAGAGHPPRLHPRS